MIWYHLNNLTGLLIEVDNEQGVFFDSAAHVTIVSTTPAISEVVYLEREHRTPIEVITDVVSSRRFSAGGLV